MIDIFNILFYNNVFFSTTIKTGKLLLFSLFQIIATIIGSVIGQCPTDTLTPCTCSSNSSVTALPNIVNCNRVSLSQVKSVFTTNVKTYYIPSLILTPSSSDSIIIANVTANHAIGSLTINCPNRITPLQVDPSAFTNTKLATSSLTVQNCNLSSLNWAFLTDFSNLSSLSISSASDLHQTFYTLPTSTLTILSSFNLFSVMGMNNFYNTSRKFRWPAPAPYGFDSVRIWYCYDLGDDAIDYFFTRFITPSSEDTLLNLGLAGNNITYIPKDVQRYNQLRSSEFFENLQPWSIQTNAFQFQQPVNYLSIDDNQITYIAPGAFSGTVITKTQILSRWLPLSSSVYTYLQAILAMPKSHCTTIY